MKNFCDNDNRGLRCGICRSVKDIPVSRCSQKGIAGSLAEKRREEMANVYRNILFSYIAGYAKYLDKLGRGENERPLSNEHEDYKREVAVKAAETLKCESWNESEIGTGTIADRAIKAVQRNQNLIGRFQVSVFSDKVKKDYEAAERILYDLYHERKDEECFERLCDMFGRKYDLIAYLYFILDPSRYLPLRSTIFDKIFKRMHIDLQTAGRCSWENYQEFLSTVAAVRDVMRGYFYTSDVDLLDAHSFLWTMNQDVVKQVNEDDDIQRGETKKKVIEVGASVVHKSYGEGTISKITEENIYVLFDIGSRIFPYPKAFEKEYLKLN